MQVGDGNTEVKSFASVALGGSPSGEGLGRTRRRPWRVFLSHTGELSEFPVGGSFVAAAKRAVERAGHAVVEMDTWTAADHPPSQVDARKLADCDVYVGIVGFRWGSPVREDPARSYTEAEFDTATRRGLRRLVFVLAEDPEPGFNLDTKDGDQQKRLGVALLE
jgi:hypothetical protein